MLTGLLLSYSWNETQYAVAGRGLVDLYISRKVKVKVLVYSLVLAAAAIHTTLQASHYLPVRELH